MDKVTLPDVSASDSREKSSGLQEPSTQTESETTVYIDVTGNFAARQPCEERTAELQDDKRDESEVNEEEKPQEEQSMQLETENLGGNKNLETLEEMPETEEEITGSELQLDDTETRMQCADDEVAQLVDDGEVDVTATTVDVELEVTRIDVGDSEDDERDSASVFSTCDEWMESPSSGRMLRDLSTSLPTLTEDISDSIAGLPEPDGVDLPPMAPRGEARGIFEVLQPAATATSASNLRDMPKFSCADPRSSASARCHCAQVDRSADRPASCCTAGITSTKAQRPIKRRPQSAASPPLGGRAPYQAGRAPPMSKSAPRPTPASAGVSRTSTRSSDKPSTRCSRPMQSHERAATSRAAASTIKPICQKGRKPAWK